MSDPTRLTRPGKPDLAYVYTPRQPAPEPMLPVMFLGGFRSDMTGTKATYLEAQAKSRGQGYLRFDYSGHGISGGKFEDGTIGGWKQDALDILDHVFPRQPVVLVGSSMGGWLSLLIALERPQQIKGVVGIAAAADFTKTIEEMMTPAQRRQMDEKGFITQPNDYGEPYVFTRNFLEEGQKHFLLSGLKRKIATPIRLVQGAEDAEVPVRTALALERAFEGGDLDVIIIDDGDHRLSRPEDLALIDGEVVSLGNITS